MATNYTTKSAGDWETTGQVVWNEVGKPVSGDRITSFAHNITPSVSEVVGTSPSTGGLAAITWGGAATLLVGAGISITAQGNAIPGNAGIIQIEAGGTFQFKPASGQLYGFDSDVGQSWRIIANGTSGSHATLQTDKSLGGLSSIHVQTWGYVYTGLYTATYLDVIDFGTTSAWGLQVSTNGGSPGPISITDSTFTRSNLNVQIANDVSVTLQRSRFLSSPGINTGFTSSAVFRFNASLAGTTAVWLVDSNGFDGDVDFSTYKSRLQFTNNVFQNPGMSDSSAWSSAANWAGNIMYMYGNTIKVNGPSQNCLCYHTQTDGNPHYVTAVANGNFTGWVFQAKVGPSGDIIFPPASGAISVTYCMVIKSSDGVCSGDLLSCLSPVAPDYTADHNTYYGRSGENGMFGMDETGGSVAAQARSVQSNYCWSDDVNNKANCINSLAPTTNAVNSVTKAGTNGFWNPVIGTCRYNTTTVQANVVGYNGLRISVNTAYPNSQVGDVTVAGDALVDSSYLFEDAAADCLGADGTDLDAYYKAIADPVAATNSTTGIIALIKAAQRVTGSQGLLLKDAGHDSATIGAMGYVAAGGGSTAATLLAIGVI